MDVQFFFDMKDCLVDEEARASFFGSSSIHLRIY